MKYISIIDTDEYKDFEFFEDGNGKYIHGIDAGAVNNEWIPLYFTECEQEPKILDKIRTEIQENINFNKKMNYQGIVAGLLLALLIIDKYKTESEGSDANKPK